MKFGKLPTLPWYVRLLAFLVVAGAAYAGFYYFVTSGTRAETKTMNEEIAKLRPMNAQAQIVQQNLNNFKALYKAREEEFAELKALLPEQRLAIRRRGFPREGREGYGQKEQQHHPAVRRHPRVHRMPHRLKILPKRSAGTSVQPERRRRLVRARRVPRCRKSQWTSMQAGFGRSGRCRPSQLFHFGTPQRDRSSRNETVRFTNLL